MPSTTGVQSIGFQMSEAEAGTSSGPKVNPTKLSDPPCHPHLTALPFQDRPEPRGRKPNEYLPPSRAREVQRAFRLRRAEHLAVLEERITNLESENSQLRAMLALPETDRGKIGSGPTGRGKSLREGGVPMSERVRARKEARARERHARGLPEADSSEASDHGRDSTTLSPRASDTSHPPFFSNPAQDASAPFNYQLPMPFNLPVSPGSQFPDFSNNLEQALYKPAGSTTPGFSGMFSLFDTPSSGARRAPISPPPTQPASASAQPDLLTRLKACCHLSDSHVVHDPGLLIFATRLCQSFSCQFSGVHLDHGTASDGDYLLLEDSWKALKAQLDPGGEADGENRINTGRMAAELVCRAAHSRGTRGAWILCRYREGMSVKRTLVAGLVQGFGGKFE